MTAPRRRQQPTRPEPPLDPALLELVRALAIKAAAEDDRRQQEENAGEGE